MAIKRKKSATKKKASWNKITSDMVILDIVQAFPQTFEVFQKYGFHCVGCPSAQFENLEQGASAHGINIKELVKDLNKAIKKGK